MYQNVSFSTSETFTVLPNITILNAPLQTTLLNILCWMYSLGITSDCKSKMGSELHNMLTLKVWLKLVKLGKTCKLFSGIKYMYCRKRHNLVGVGFLKNPSACRHLVLVQNCLCVRPHVSHKVWLLQAFNEIFGTKVFFILFFFIQSNIERQLLSHSMPWLLPMISLGFRENVMITKPSEMVLKHLMSSISICCLCSK